MKRPDSCFCVCVCVFHFCAHLHLHQFLKLQEKIREQWARDSAISVEEGGLSFGSTHLLHQDHVVHVTFMTCLPSTLFIVLAVWGSLQIWPHCIQHLSKFTMRTFILSSLKESSIWHYDISIGVSVWQGMNSSMQQVCVWERESSPCMIETQVIDFSFQMKYR